MSNTAFFCARFSMLAYFQRSKAGWWDCNHTQKTQQTQVKGRSWFGCLCVLCSVIYLGGDADWGMWHFPSWKLILPGLEWVSKGLCI